MPDRPKALYEKYDAIPETGLVFPAVPKHIRDNLSYPLRPYQQEAIGRWLQYMDYDTVNKTLPVELLFNMATGSGKTLIMAALILDLYRRGYRNFIYFVNSTNIIEKTRDNFTNPASNKFLFAENILIDGERVQVKDVKTFSDAQDNSINILFTTIQGLHTDLNIPRENRLSYHDFQNLKVALLGDEAHHNNSKTLMTKDQLADNRSWEATVNNIMSSAKDPVLLEFTATIDLEDSNIYEKYHNRIIYKYDLKHFRSDGYSKDVLIYHVDSDLKTRMLQAIIISQYRKKVALRHGILLKPVLLFKSRLKKDNKDNYQIFTNLIKNLSSRDISAQKQTATGILADAFTNLDLSPADLAAELKDDFRPERLLLVDGNNISPAKQLQLNSLEDPHNEIRAVFAVDMLNEGWDVLNLFDIVRLYDTRDAKNNQPGKTTTREAQLIGRGARYFPFATDDPDQKSDEPNQKYVRKFDHDENSELRILEQLHYHSANNPKYIQEIRQALISSGIMAENYQERVLNLKRSFKNSELYQTGRIYVNARETLTDHAQRLKHSDSSILLGWDFRNQILEINLPTGLTGVTTIFDDHTTANEFSSVTYDSLETIVKKLVPPHIMRHAMRRNKTFRFCNIQQKMPGVNSVDNFIQSIGELALSVRGHKIKQNGLTPEQQLYIADRVLANIDSQFIKNDETYVGTSEFIPLEIAQVFKDHIKRKYFLKDAASDQEFGEPQSYPKNPKYALNLRDKKWYAYDENYGTSEEKSLVLTLDGIMEELSQHWTDIYLLRNEGAFKIYSFDDGRAFAPDFVLFASSRANDKAGSNINSETTNRISWQIFIEPKGNQLRAKDQWKEDFLLQIQNQKGSRTFADNQEFRIIGLPFYNESTTKREVIEKLTAHL